MNEYGEMAKYYDMFYVNKSYSKEIDFIKKIIGNRKYILDLGCGTGRHMKLLEELNFVVDGIDLNDSMLDVARKKVKGNLYSGDIVSYQLDKKYDVIISMFAVFNHFKNSLDFEKCIINWYKNLNFNGIMIIDLHNGRHDGIKEDVVGNCKRIMKWTFDSVKFTEHTDIIYEIDGKIFNGYHDFIIYKLEDIINILDRNNFKYDLYENYSLNVANDDSKNIQIVIRK